ncbi:MAG: hypothetical protein NW214_14815 [Pseudanabaenaceae cyanobacterium bins.39]|nr:hypothetical protein [Pseudanabaenaceae cyanobacterium bins.39]
MASSVASSWLSYVFVGQAYAQSTSLVACSQVSNRKYAVMVDRPASMLPQLREFLAIAAVPCHYLNTSMTFFGGFDNANASTFRANQLRELGIDAVVHSFLGKANDIPAALQASMVLVESTGETNTTIQQIRSLTGKNAIAATFNNRSVLLAAPLSSPASANAIASSLRNQRFSAQVISAALLAPNSNSSSPRNGTATTPRNNAATTYRVLVPNRNANTLTQVRAIAADAFPIKLNNVSYIQARTYTDVNNANRERDRLNIRFPGTIVIKD